MARVAAAALRIVLAQQIRDVLLGKLPDSVCARCAFDHVALDGRPIRRGKAALVEVPELVGARVVYCVGHRSSPWCPRVVPRLKARRGESVTEKHGVLVGEPVGLLAKTAEHAR